VVWNNALGTLVKDVPFLQVYGTQSANTFFAGPVSGGATFPTWRALVLDDLPVGVNVISTYDTVAALTAATVSATVNTVTTLGYYARGDGGGATYVRVSGAPTLSCYQTSNSGASFWDLPDRSTINAKVCGAKGDGSTNDTTAISNSITALPARGGTVFFPSGNYICTTICINILNKTSISFQGAATSDGGTVGASALTFTGSTGSLIHLDGTEAISFNQLNFTYTSASFAGDLIDLTQVSGAVNTSFTSIRNFRIGGTASAKSAVLINASKTLKTNIDTGFMQYANFGIVGAKALSTYFSNGMIINNVWFDAVMVVPIVAGGNSWTISNCIFEPPNGAGTAQGITVTPAGVNGLSIINASFEDALNLGTWIHFGVNTYGTPGQVTGLSITGSLFQGAAQSIYLNGASGVSITGNFFSQGGTSTYIDSIGASQVIEYSNTFVGSSGAAFNTLPTNSIFFNRGNTSLQVTGLQSLANANVLCYNSTTGEFTYQVSGTGCAASSLRFKQDIKLIASDSAFDIITKLDPISFIYKPESDLGADKHVGLAAEQVATIAPDLVGFEADGVTPYAVKYQEITPLLIGAIKKLKADNDNLASCQASWKCRLFGIGGSHAK